MVNLAAAIFCGGVAIMEANLGYAWIALLTGFMSGMNTMIVMDKLTAKSHGRGQ